MTLHRGKIARAPTITGVRPLTRDDLAILREPRSPKDAAGGVVQRLRDPHHRLARMFAAGLRLAEIVSRSGYSYAHVASLQRDPAFQELIAKYREKVVESFVTDADPVVQEAMEQIHIGQRMVRETLERADEDGTPIPLRQLIALNADNMDRFGYGKRQMNLNVNADFAALLEKTISRSGKGKTIEGVVATQPLQSQPVIDNPAADHGSESAPQARLRRI